MTMAVGTLIRDQSCSSAHSQLCSTFDHGWRRSRGVCSLQYIGYSVYQLVNNCFHTRTWINRCSFKKPSWYKCKNRTYSISNSVYVLINSTAHVNYVTGEVTAKDQWKFWAAVQCAMHLTPYVQCCWTIASCAWCAHELHVANTTKIHLSHLLGQ